MKLHCRVLLLVALLVALLPALSAAQPSGEKRQELAKQLQERFVAADKNGDGQLSREEAKAGMPRVSQNFDVIDADGKGFVTLDDLRAYFGEKLRKRAGSAS